MSYTLKMNGTNIHNYDALSQACQQLNLQLSTQKNKPWTIGSGRAAMWIDNKGDLCWDSDEGKYKQGEKHDQLVQAYTVATRTMAAAEFGHESTVMEGPDGCRIIEVDIPEKQEEAAYA